MKAILGAILIVQLATPVFAQGKGPPSGDNGKAAKAASETQRERKDNETAAKAAMSKIPDSKEKYDPWKIGR